MLLSLIVFSKSAKNLKKDNNNRDSVIVLRNPNYKNQILIEKNSNLKISKIRKETFKKLKSKILYILGK